MTSEFPESIGDLGDLKRFVLVGNQVAKSPEQCRLLENLKSLDCRRNLIANSGVIAGLKKLNADHNPIFSSKLEIGGMLVTLDALYNDVTQISIVLKRQRNLVELVACQKVDFGGFGFGQAQFAQGVAIRS